MYSFTILVEFLKSLFLVAKVSSFIRDYKDNKEFVDILVCM